MRLRNFGHTGEVLPARHPVVKARPELFVTEEEKAKAPTRRRPARPETDPLELGRQALQVLKRMHLEGAYQRGLREEAAELVRQLAWGPSV